jgi:Fe2+ or Zn2+ uptake regulation protein
MDRLFLLIAGLVAVGLYFVIAPVVTNTYRRYRNRKTIICPDTGQIVEVELKAVRASLMSTLGKHSVRVKWCSLWPRKKGCAQECVKEDWWSRE